MASSIMIPLVCVHITRLFSMLYYAACQQAIPIPVPIPLPIPATFYIIMRRY